jgi:hypothetical protein
MSSRMWFNITGQAFPDIPLKNRAVVIQWHSVPTLHLHATLMDTAVILLHTRMYWNLHHVTLFPNASSYSFFSLSLCFGFLLVIFHVVSSFLSLTLFYDTMNARSLQSCFLIGHAIPTSETMCTVTIYRLTTQ